MPMHTPNPDRELREEEFVIYLLLYAAGSDGIITPEEVGEITRKDYGNYYPATYEQYKQDDEYTRLQRIESGKARYLTTTAARERMYAKIKDLFSTDNRFTATEQYIAKLLLA